MADFLRRKQVGESLRALKRDMSERIGRGEDVDTQLALYRAAAGAFIDGAVDMAWTMLTSGRLPLGVMPRKAGRVVRVQFADTTRGRRSKRRAAT